VSDVIAEILERADPVQRPSEDAPWEFDFGRHYEVVRKAIRSHRDLVHGTMTYACMGPRPTREEMAAAAPAAARRKGCGYEHRVYLGLGVEGPEALREAGLVIPCPFYCGTCPECDSGMAHVRFADDEHFDPRPRPDGVPYFVVPGKKSAADHAAAGYGGADYVGPARAAKPTDEEPASYRCTRCEYRPTKGEVAKGLRGCPRCGASGSPMADKDDVEIKVNWHELRVLGIWAENHAQVIRDEDSPQLSGVNDPQRVVNIICGRLHAQFPDKPALTMSGELAELRQSEGVGDVEVEGFREDPEANPEGER
jgi:hypothetical protein